ncbi:MAG: hypothetical protein Q8Q01_00615 [archaeon]|nr:hypothetical protein [archaeon]
MVKKKGRKKKLSLGLHVALVVIVLSASFAFWLTNSEDNLLIEATPPIDETLNSYPIDFPTTEAGTFSGILNENYFKEPIDSIVLLFASKKLPGFAIKYYSEEHKLVTGTPPMVAEDVFLFNGIKTQLVYTFKKDGEQVLFIDGLKVVSSSFKLNQGSLLTGMVTGSSELFVSDGFESVNVG